MKTQFKSISVRNFMSFGNKNTTFSLDQDKVILIIGENKDIGDSGESRNGVGKTTLLNAIIFALYGKGIESLKVDEYINIVNEKDLYVELDFSIGEDDFKIIRTRKPNSVTFSMNGTNLSLDSMSNTDDLIVDYVGFDYEVFMTMFFLSPVKRPFMGMKGAEQRDIIEKILSLDTLSKRAESLKAVAADITTELKLANRDHENAVKNQERVAATIERLNRKHLEHLDELVNVRDDLQQDLVGVVGLDVASISEEHERAEKAKTRIDELKSDHYAIVTEINTVKRDIVDITKYVSVVERNLTKVDEWNVDNADAIDKATKSLSTLRTYTELESVVELIKSAESVGSKLTKLDDDLEIKHRTIDSLDRKLKKSVEFAETLKGGKCPTCSQQHFDKDLLAEYEGSIATLNSDISDHKSAIGDITDNISVVENELSGILEQIGEDTIKSVNIEMNKIRDLDATIARLRGETNPYEGEDTIDDVRAAKEEIAKQEVVLGTLTDRADAIAANIDELSIDLRLSDEASQYTPAELALLERSIESTNERIKTIDEKIASGWSPFIEELEHSKGSVINLDDSLDVINELDDDLRHLKYLTKLLTDNKSFIRKNIVEQYIPYVNKKIVEYSNKVDLSHISQINSDMSVDIDYMSRPVSFGSLSAGEKMRLNLATTAAFNDLLGMLGKGSNLMLIDELFDSSLDPCGMHKSFKFVTEFASNILMISHRQELVGEVDDIITIRKENGFSSIV